MPTGKNTSPEVVTLDHPLNKKMTEEWRNLTPHLAETWLGQNHDNRNLRPEKIRAFARDMRNGEWTTTGQPIQFDWTGNLIDGQHRCEAVIESGVTIRVLVVKGLDPKAKQVIDTGTKRTPADALRFAGYSHDATVTAAAARLAMGREAGFMRTAFSRTSPNITNAETVAWVDTHDDISSAVALARKTAKRIGIAPSAWAYCLWEMERIDGTIAVEFAMTMADYRALRGKGDPRVAMLTAFRNAQQGQRRVPEQAEAIYIAFRAWNAWVSDKTLVSVIPRDPTGKGNEIPRLIAPTDTFRRRYSS